MLNYLLYEWEILRGAWHSTIHFVREHLLADIVIGCASFAGGVIVNPTNLQGIHNVLFLGIAGTATAFFLLFVCNVFLMPYRIWKEQRREIFSYREKEIPRIGFSFNKEHEGFLTHTLAKIPNDPYPPRETIAIYVRVQVKNISSAKLTNCKVILNHIATLDSSGEYQSTNWSDPYQLAWAKPDNERFAGIDLLPEIPVMANVIAAYDDDKKFLPVVNGLPFIYEDVFVRPTKYKLTLMATCNEKDKPDTASLYVRTSKEWGNIEVDLEI